MKSGMEILKERAEEKNVELTKEIPASVFSQLGLPLIVACTGCGMTMCFPSCYVDENDFLWCGCCAGEDFSPNDEIDFPEEIDESMSPHDGICNWASDDWEY
ncbi:MAG: hypothetical protein M0R46_18070 [Candidatus Muirbacterium halophilum]|nr:hypothetical protein [Candidatus Muirbacterium halophilum]